MVVRGMRRWWLWGLLVLAACLALGQNCAGPAPSNVPIASACGLHAAYCVEVIGKSPLAVAAGDFNRDGAIDLAVANFGTDNVELLFNDGRGRLTSAGKYKVGDSPGTIAAADFDGDGNLDLAASDGLGVAVLINRGDGTFEPAVHVDLDPQINAFPISMTAADLDGDGAVDLAAAGLGYRFEPDFLTVTNLDNVAILHNNGSGTFTLTQTIIIDNPFPRLGDITAGDVDGDGRADLIVDQSSGLVTVLLNQGAGSFAVALALDLGANHILSDVKVADLNGDGRGDLIVADNGDPLDPANDGGDVAVFYNLGNGSFAQALLLQAGWAPTSIGVADVDGDSLPDLVVANNLSNDVSVLVNQGGGGFEPPWTFASGDGPTSVALADFNGNGIVDLAVSHMNSGAVGVYLNDGTGDFTSGR